MKKSPLNRKVLALLLATSFVAASCGSDDDSKSTDTTAAATETTAASTDTTAASAETTAVSGDTTATTGVVDTVAEETTTTWAPDPNPIKLGTMVWTLPQLALKVGRITGIQAAIQAINERGGIHGRQIEYTVCEATDPNTGDACARQFVEAGVVATIADVNLVAEASSTAILNEAGIPQLDAFVNTPEALSSPNVFLIAPGTPVQYLSTVEFMKLDGVKTLQFMPAAISSAKNSEVPVTAAAEKYGITITGRTEISLSAADYTPIVSDAASSNADAYMPIIAPFQTDLLLQAMQQLGLKMRIAIGEGQFNAEQYEAYGQPGGPLDGALLSDVIPPIAEAANYPELQRALDELAAYYETSGAEDAAPGKLTTITTRAWLDMQAFYKVADAQTEITAESIMNGLNTMTDIDLGLLKWTPSTKGPAGYDKVSNSLQYLSTVTDGKVVLYQKEPIDALASLR